MKKSKIKIFIISFMLSLFSISLFSLGALNREDVYAASDMEITASKTFSTSTLNSRFNLYSDGAETASYYSLAVLDANSSITGSTTISGNAIESSINASGVRPGYNNKTILKATTKLQLSDNLFNAAKNGYLQIVLHFTFNPPNGDNHYADISSGGQVNTSTTYSSSSASSFTLELLDYSSKTITINFYSKCRNLGLVQTTTNKLKVTNPYLEIKSSDTSSPRITNLNYTKGWSAENKEVTFQITESESGIQFVNLETTHANGEVSNQSLNPNVSGIYSFTAKQDESYVVTTKDNVNNYDDNKSQITLTKDDLQIDTTGVNPLVVSDIEDTHEEFITFTSTFTEDPHSQEYIYYTLYALSDYDPDIAKPNTSCNKLINGSNTISLAGKNVGDYVLSMIVIDGVGHESDKVIKKTFKFDNTRYLVSANVVHGEFEISGATMMGDETEYHAWLNDQITITYTADEGYEFYQLLRNGTPVSASANKYVYACNSNFTFEIKFRYRVLVTDYEGEYTFDPSGNLKFDYTLNTDNVDIIYSIFVGEDETALFDAGTYTLRWSVNTDEYIGGDDIEIVVNPLEIELSYVEKDFVYNGEIQSIEYTGDENLKYGTRYEINNEDEWIECEFKNANNYRAITFVLEDENYNYQNYIIKNDTISVSIAKKEIEANIVETNFSYTSVKLNIDYSLSEDIDTIVVYEKFDEMLEDYFVSEFLNSGDYRFEIKPVDEMNYFISGSTGIARIDKVYVRFSVEKFKYDYSANEIVPVYKMYDNDDNEIDFVNKLRLQFVNLDDDTDKFESIGIYTLTFVCDDDNYILSDTEFENLIIKMTIINVSILRSEYEYTGSQIQLLYEMRNEDDEKIENAGNIDLTITCEGETVDDIIAVGEYSYEFSSGDVNYSFIGDQEGVITIIPARLSVTIVDNYQYSVDGYELDYEIVSATNVDFTHNTYITLKIYNDGNETELNNVGTYNYQFISSDENIVFVSGDIGDIVISACEIRIDVVDNYVYSGEEIDFEFTCPVDIEIDCQIDTLIDANTYAYVITSLDSNYLIINGTGSIVVNPKKITIIEFTDEYTFCESIISPVIVLSEEIDYDYSSYLNSDTECENVIDIFNKGEYKIILSSNDSNYIIIDKEIVMIVNPKNIEITIDEDSLDYIYDGQIHNVSVHLDIDAYHINYEIDGEKLDPINAGVYNFEVILDDENYVGTCTGELNISKRHALLNIVPNQQKFYGDSDSVFEYSLNNVIAGDRISISLTRESGENVGVYQINLTNYSNDNYIVNYDDIGYFKIVAKKIIVIADTQTKVYGDDDGMLTYKMYMDEKIVTKLIGDDELSGNLIRKPGENVGTYEISIGSLTNTNYQIIFVKSQYRITPRDVNVIIDSKEVVYGDHESLTYSTDIAINSDNISGEIVRESGEDVGEYAITAGTLSSVNYNLIVTNGVYRIIKKSITIRALNCAKEYGEEDCLDYVVDGLVNDDTLLGSLGRENGENVGTYEINKGSLDNSNYDITFIPATLSIYKAKLNITIDNVSQEYGKEPTDLSYNITGFKFNDSLSLKLFREAGDDVGEYDISCQFVSLDNYMIDSLVTGKYTITKSTITPVLRSKTCVYNGKSQTLELVNFPFEVEFVYKQNGFVVDAPTDAGVYSVQAIFNGNQNYLPSKSATEILTIQKQFVYLTLLDNKYIYDGEIKYPKFSFDKTIGLSEYSIIYEFENNVEPREIGTYNFVLRVNDSNFQGETQGQIRIERAFEYRNSNASIIECQDATFDSAVQDLELIETNEQKKFNNQKVLSISSFDHIDNIEKDYVYTVKIKATEGVDNVNVYKVGLSGFESMAVAVENGYYVFQVDDLNSKYFITTEIKSLNSLAWILIIVAIVLIFGIALIVVSKKKHKKAKVVESKASTNIESVSKNEENNNPDIDIYNIN